MSAIAFSRLIGPVPVDCVISEKHESDIEITEIPIESGARITDHAFVLPKRVVLDIANDNAAAAYNAFVAFQSTRVPFQLVTGLSLYRNMLIKRLTADRDKDSARILRCTVELQEIIIVSTGYTTDTSGRTSGEPGGKDSTRSTRLSKELSGDTTTGDRVTETIQRGDTGFDNVTTSDDTSYLKTMLGG
ncbi:phage baseplate protein [Shinella sp. DD12]|uniref:phage baseplate protein n=1 Tax=Shinella sp. DD12 TaxID=1410620 RepID=UPI0003C53CC3|nr:hypothetical protein [Shinella sp. DD12]EYR81380.1 hypothetical protein SHLA_15c000650 [Shinella sp. DD12]